ncbi:MAG: ribulose-phosphate 3-epimerase, partial [Selenomonadaceae bacterium]|nr:ribulose-phosphate 3-epimerase [Selenomonadaceae bacterium]
IHAAGCKAGVALNPGSSLSMIEELVEDVEMVLIMTVNPGFGGQRFIESMLGKIHMLYHMIEEMETICDIEVDGGITAETSKLVREAGANVLVAGSAIYGAPDVAKAIKDIRGEEIEHHHHH